MKTDNSHKEEQADGVFAEGDRVTVFGFSSSLVGDGVVLGPATDAFNEEDIIEDMYLVFFGDEHGTCDVYKDDMKKAGGLTHEDLASYGYTRRDMEPLTKAQALHAHCCDRKVYLLYADNTEAAPGSARDIENHKGMFGKEIFPHRNAQGRLIHNIRIEAEENSHSVFHAVDENTDVSIGGDKVLEMAQARTPFYATCIILPSRAGESSEGRLLFETLFGKDNAHAEISGITARLANPYQAVRPRLKDIYDQTQKQMADLKFEHFVGNGYSEWLDEFDETFSGGLTGFIVNGQYLLSETLFLRHCYTLPLGTRLTLVETFEYTQD